MKNSNIIVGIFLEDDLGPLIPVGPGAAAPPAPMVVTLLCRVQVYSFAFLLYLLAIIDFYSANLIFRSSR